MWLIASALFVFYVANFSSYDKTYGTFGGVVIFFVWMWLTNIYGEMLDQMAEVLDIRRGPTIPVPLISPWLSSLWIWLVTRVDGGLARPLIGGLGASTIVADASGRMLLDIKPVSFDQTLRRVAEGRRSCTH